MASHVAGPDIERISRSSSGAKNITAEGLPSSRPLSEWMRSIAASLDGSQASP